MRKSLCILAVAASLCVGPPTMAQAVKSPIVGVWKIDAVIDKDAANHESMPMGRHPVGYSVYTVDGHYMFFVTTNGGTGTLAASAGDYKLVGPNELRMHPEATAGLANPDVASLSRRFNVSGGKLTISLSAKNAAGEDVTRTGIYERIE